MADNQPESSNVRGTRKRKRIEILEEEEVLDVLEEIDSDESEDLEANLTDSEDTSSNTDDFGRPAEDSDEEEELQPAWTSQPQSDSQQFSFTGIPGMKFPVSIVEPIDFFSLLANENFYSLVVEATNNNARRILRESTSPQSRIRKWKDMDIKEFKTFLGLLFHMGTIQINRLQDYWKTGPLFNIPCFRMFMGRNRFFLIMRSLFLAKQHDEDDPTPSRLHKVKALVDFFNETMDNIYHPSRELSIDESMMLWRGRLIFRQYLKGKKHKYGIKLYMLTEPYGLVQKFIVYSGKDDQDLGGKGHVNKVVNALVQKQSDLGHSLFMDNYYNSVDLAEELLDKKTYCTGTLRGNRKNNPPEVMSTKLKKGQIIDRYNRKNICVLKWKDKRDVLMISSEFDGSMVEVTNRRGVKKMKPNIVDKYNKYMSGVDKHDQMMAYYPCERKTLRWYKKLAIHIFQMMLLNTFHLYNMYCKKAKLDFYSFRLAVITSLLEIPTKQISKTRPGKFADHFPKSFETSKKGKALRRRCKNCLSVNTRKETNYYCRLY